MVEDEESLRELTSRVLTRNGYRVLAAQRGEAIGWQRPRDGHRPVLTDVMMPQMLGDEVADQVRAIQPGVPALFMSGYAEPVLHRQGVAAGPDGDPGKAVHRSRPCWPGCARPWTRAWPGLLGLLGLVGLMRRVRGAVSGTRRGRAGRRKSHSGP